MFFPNRHEFNILNELRILRITFLVIRKIHNEAIVGKKQTINIFNLNNLYDVTDSIINYWYKFLTSCVNVKLNKNIFTPLLEDEPNKYPTLKNREMGEESNDSCNEKKIIKPEYNKKNIFEKLLQRKSIFKSPHKVDAEIKNNDDSSQDIMMYTFKSIGNIYKSHMKKLLEKQRKKFKLPEYKNLKNELEKISETINC